MKLIKWVLNLLLLAVSYCVISVCTFTVYSLVCLQADDRTARISIGDEPDRVWFLDSYAYWGTAISSEISDKTPDTKVRTANWFSWGWWKDAGGGVDKYVVNPLVAIIKPIVLPINCADEIKEYYDKDVTDYVEYINKDAAVFNAMAEKYFDAHIGTTVVDDKNVINEENLRAEAHKFSLSEIAERDLDGNGKKDIYDVADDYNYFYQMFFKLHKYNKTAEKYITEKNPEGKIYYKWFHKFVRTSYNSEGVEIDKSARTLTTGVYGLYFLSYINIVLALFFLYLNPIEIDRNEDGTVSPSNNVMSRFRWQHRNTRERREERRHLREEKRRRKDERRKRKQERRERKRERRRRRRGY